jgi:hypothetical protein
MLTMKGLLGLWVRRCFFSSLGAQTTRPRPFPAGPSGFRSSPQTQRTRVPFGPPERVVVVVVLIAAKQFMAVSVA